MTKTPSDKWLVFATRFDAFRVFPRLLLIGYYLFFAWAWIYVVNWFIAFDWNEINEPTVALAIAGFPAAVLGILTGVLSNLTGHYMKTGNFPGRGPAQ